MHVLISGAGLSGLALAQGLLKEGHTVEVYERDADLSRQNGYLLNINGLGGESLRRLLPEDLFELYVDTSRRPFPRQESIVYDPQLNELGARPSMGPPNTGERRHTGVDRRTLRQILDTRIEHLVHRGVAGVGYREDADGVVLVLDDGREVRGDLLVAADGIRSAIRDQKLPGTEVVPTQIMGISLYARSPLTPEILALTPDSVHNGILIVTDDRGNRCLLGSFQPRVPLAEAAARVDGCTLEEREDYMMVSCSVPPELVVPPMREWTDQTPQQIKDGMRATVASWHPAVRAIVDNVDTDTLFAIRFSYLRPEEQWPSSRVTVIGDAAHGMLPTLGMGANCALGDAAYLLDQLVAADGSHEGLVGAVAASEQHMRENTYPVLQMTVDHDKVFGGGALAKAGASGDDH